MQKYYISVNAADADYAQVDFRNWAKIPAGFRSELGLFLQRLFWTCDKAARDCSGQSASPENEICRCARASVLQEAMLLATCTYSGSFRFTFGDLKDRPADPQFLLLVFRSIPHLLIAQEFQSFKWGDLW